MKRIIVLAALVLTTTSAAADPLPVTKTSGTCPGGYASGASYCSPGSSHWPRAIVKVGACPSGWSDVGTYCVEVSRSC
jgi:hypothetical protein